MEGCYDAEDFLILTTIEEYTAEPDKKAQAMVDCMESFAHQPLAWLRNQWWLKAMLAFQIKDPFISESLRKHMNDKAREIHDEVAI